MDTMLRDRNLSTMLVIPLAPIVKPNLWFLLNISLKYISIQKWVLVNAPQSSADEIKELLLYWLKHFKSIIYLATKIKIVMPLILWKCMGTHAHKKKNSSC